VVSQRYKRDYLMPSLSESRSLSGPYGVGRVKLRVLKKCRTLLLGVFQKETLANAAKEVQPQHLIDLCKRSFTFKSSNEDVGG